jgi:hypothetical protein
MSDWREDNFVERLARRSWRRAALLSCPAADSLGSVAVSAGLAAIPSRLGEHIGLCPTCSDLHRRLLLFDRPANLDLDSDTIQAGERLDSWLKGFLAAQPARSQAPATPLPKVISFPLSSNPQRFWNVQLVLAAAAMFVIAASALYIRRSTTPHSPTPESARATPNQPPTARSDSQTSPLPMPASQSHPQTAWPKTSARPNSSSANKSTVPVSPSESAATPEQSTEIASQATSPVEKETPASAENDRVSTPWSAPVHPVLPPAQASLSQGAISRAPAAEVGASSCAACSSSSKPPARSAPPLLIHIPAGTRIWISLGSAIPPDDGPFQFQGTLLLPVTDSGAVLLAAGTPIAGSGRTLQKQTSIQIAEFAIGGQRYRIASAAKPSAEILGAGKAVRFQEGRVFEMWLDSTSAFELLDRSSGTPRN